MMALLGQIQLWATENKARVAKVIFALGPEGYELYVCPRDAAYDFALTEALSAFAIKLSDGGFSVYVSQIPDASFEELEAYFSSKQAMAFTPV